MCFTATICSCYLSVHHAAALQELCFALLDWQIVLEHELHQGVSAAVVLISFTSTKLNANWGDLELHVLVN